MCEVFLTNINLPTNDKKWRAGHLKFLVRLVKLVKRPGVCFGVASKMRNFIRRKFVSMSPLVRGWMVLYTLYFPAHRHFQLFCSRYPSFLKNDQVLSSVIKCYEELSSVIKCYQGLSSVIKWYQVVSSFIKCNQVLSDDASVIKCYHVLSTVFTCYHVVSSVIKWPFYGHSNLGADWTLVVHRHRP